MLARLLMWWMMAATAGLGASTALAIPLTGSQNDLSGSGTLASQADVQDWTFVVGSTNGLFSVLTTSESSMQLEIRVTDAFSTLEAEATAATLGAPADVLHLFPVDAGIWHVTVQTLASAGAYKLRVIGEGDAVITSDTSVPEPASATLVAIGLAAIFSLRQRLFADTLRRSGLAVEALRVGA